MEHITVKEIIQATGGILLCGDSNTPLCHISIDSRTMQGDDLFVPLVGDKVDAHRFIEQAFERGAAAVLTSEHDSMVSARPYIRVRDTRRALQSIGTYYRNRLTLPLIAITGSVGKTTTREMVACALSARYRVYKTPANHNSQVGVPITISGITDMDEIGVLELGMSEPGELTVIAKIAKPQMAVITNIGVTHIEQLGSKENIYKEKLSIQDGLQDGGILFLNGDDMLLRETAARPGFKTIYYGTGENCDYRAEDIALEEGYPVFTAVHGEERVPVRLKVMGSHHVLNAMVSLAVSAENEIPMAEAAVKLKEFTGFDNRQQVYHVNGITVIDDTYNASPASMKAGLSVLFSMNQAKRRIAVLADMKELGAGAPGYHYEIGAYLAGHQVEELITLGELAKEIARGAITINKKITVHSFMEREQLARYLQGSLKKGDCVLLKGSNSMRLGEVVSFLLEGNS